MAMASSMGYCIAEAYVMRKTHMEGMRKEEEARVKREGVVRRSEDKVSSGCFPWRHKKLRATRVVSVNSFSKEDETLDHKS